MRWRWDQGRLDYFRFDSLCAIAKALVALEGVSLNQPIDPLREVLEQETNLPFAPTHYTVWRNYARVFRWALLAGRIEGRLTITDVCRKLASEGETGWGVDDYLSFLIPRFYYPSPATQDYISESSNQQFPLCAILKFLLAHSTGKNQRAITIEEVFGYLIGNEVTGLEPITHYQNLPFTPRTPIGDEWRQVRELLIFLSQSSFLKWINSTLYLDITTSDIQTYNQLQSISTPHPLPRQGDADAEVIRLGTVSNELIVVASTPRELPEDILFTEGRRIRVSHLRIERSPRLRNLYFSQVKPPFLCDMCQSDMTHRYPWTENILELHHLLPLSSAIRITTSGTSLNDLVPLCPNCHKSVHVYYKFWLNDHQLQDFTTPQQAENVYNDAKEQMVW